MVRCCLPLILLSACAPADPPLLVDESNQPATVAEQELEPDSGPASSEERAAER